MGPKSFHKIRIKITIPKSISNKPPKVIAHHISIILKKERSETIRSWSFKGAHAHHSPPYLLFQHWSSEDITPFTCNPRGITKAYSIRIHTHRRAKQILVEQKSFMAQHSIIIRPGSILFFFRLTTI